MSMAVAFLSRVLILDSQGQGKVRWNTSLTFEVLLAAPAAEIYTHFQAESQQYSPHSSACTEQWQVAQKRCSAGARGRAGWGLSV